MESELDEELRDHLERKTEDGVARGLTNAEARRVALLELGGIEQEKEMCRDTRGVRWLEDFLQDVRFGLRWLRKSPGFSATVILALALGLGANTALFSLFNRVLLQALPVRQPEQLVVLNVANERSDSVRSFSYPMYRGLRDNNTVFSGLLAQAGAEMNATYNGQSEKARGELVSGNYFETLGVRPWRGRLFTQADDRILGAHPVVVLSYDYWQRRFAGDPGIVGRKLILNNHPMTVVGVTPPGFYGTDLSDQVDLRVPMMMVSLFRPFPPNRLERSGLQWMEVIGRLQPDLSREQAEAGADVVYRQLHEAELRESPFGSDYEMRVARSSHLKLLPGSQGLRQLQTQFSHALVILFGITLVILLITCANLANLFLARNAARQHEIAMRLALGATRRRLVRQWLTESLLFAFAGGGSASVVAIWTQSLLLHFLPPNDRANLSDSAIDPAVFGFAFAAALVVAILFGIIPALQISRSSLAPQQGDPRLTSSGMSLRNFRGLLVLLQIALCLPLLIGPVSSCTACETSKDRAGIRSEPCRARVTQSIAQRLSARTRRALYDELLARVRALPGVQAAALGTGVVLSGGWDALNVTVEGYRPREGEDMSPYANTVTPGYFATMRMPIVAGRDFDERDNLAGRPVGVINQTMARYFFGDENPIGKKFGNRNEPAARHRNYWRGPGCEIRQSPREAATAFLFIGLAAAATLRYDAACADGGGSARHHRHPARTLQQIDPNVPLYNFKTLEGGLNDSLARDRLITWLSTAFGALATLWRRSVSTA